LAVGQGDNSIHFCLRRFFFALPTPLSGAVFVFAERPDFEPWRCFNDV
jgi:hypothetical protein